jgi:hypothetical protein
MSVTEIKYRLAKLTPRKNEEIEQEFAKFTEITNGSTSIFIYNGNNESYSGIGGNKDFGFCSGKKCFSWNSKEQWWYRKIEIKHPSPKYEIFTMYGEFSYGEERLSFVLIRIPGSKINWHRTVVPELRKIANLLSGKKKTYWNVDSYEGIEKTWEKSKLPLKRFFWRGDKLVEKRKA